MVVAKQPPQVHDALAWRTEEASCTPGDGMA